MAIRRASLFTLFLLAFALHADDPKPKLTPLPKTFFDLDDVKSPCSVELSPDGRFVYSASFEPGCVAVHERDAKTGELKLVEKVMGEPYMEGAVRTELSKDGNRLAAACFRAKAIVLFDRDEKTGKLKYLSHVGAGDDSEPFHWAISPTWSPDGKFIYASDSYTNGGPDGNADGRIVVLKVEEGGKLRIIERYHPGDNSATNLRGLCMHPDGRTLFGAAAGSGTLGVFNRDPETGKLNLRQVLRTGDRVKGLGGIMAVVCSPDGKTVYTTSGRFKDETSEDAVNVFQLASDGMLYPLQHFEGEKHLSGFAGGNRLALSPDGLALYATGTNSNHLACFDRDPATGKLTVREVVAGWKEPELKGVNGLAVSPDGKHLYATWEFSKGLSAFERPKP